MTKNDTKTPDVDRGLPSVNEAKGKSGNKLVILLFLCVVVGIVGGAGYWFVSRLTNMKHSVTKQKKPHDEQTAVKSRTFGNFAAPAPIPLNGEAGVTAPTPSGPLSGNAGVGVTVPAPLPEAKVPANGPSGAPSRPAPIGVKDNRSNRARGGDVAYGDKSGHDAAQEQNASPYDSAFVVNGDLQPGGTATAGSQFAAAAERGTQALAATTLAMSQTKPDSGKGAMSGMLTGTSTPMVRAGLLGDMNLTVAKGTPVECVLSTRIVAMLPGFVRCRLTNPLYSANGKVILAGRGSEVTGEQSGAMKQGQTRLYVLWTELRTPEGITIPIDSPAADALGSPGLDGEVDNHWGPRVGAALMFSMIQDAFALETAKASSSSSGNSSGAGTVAFQNTQQSGERIAEKILDSTINIPPTLYKNQGDKISITIARNLDFSSVYSIQAK